MCFAQAQGSDAQYRIFMIEGGSPVIVVQPQLSELGPGKNIRIIEVTYQKVR